MGCVGQKHPGKWRFWNPKSWRFGLVQMMFRISIWVICLYRFKVFNFQGGWIHNSSQVGIFRGGIEYNQYNLMRKQFSPLFRGSCDNMLLYPFSWRVDMSCKRWIANKKWKMLQQGWFHLISQTGWVPHLSTKLDFFIYPVILRILGFWTAPPLVGKYIIPTSKSLSQYHGVAIKTLLWLWLYKSNYSSFTSNFERKPLQKLHHSTVMSSILSDSFHLSTMKQMNMEKIYSTNHP